MSERLHNYLGGRWQVGQGDGVALHDPVRGDELARVSAVGLDLREGFSFARQHGGAALRAMTYRERAAMLGAIVEVLQRHRDRYYEIALRNSGTVARDSAIDIDGAIYTLGVYAKLGESLGDRRWLHDGDAAALGKASPFQSRHVLTPTRGVALCINAFNFPSWGLWEKAAPALLSGVPVIAKPATATAWLAQQMVRDVVAAAVVPPGALSIVCGGADGLLDALDPFDVVSFTGSAQTAAVIRSHPAITAHSVRVNIEADSLNAALVLPGEAPDGEALSLLLAEAVREMTVKSGQKCTAIRRIFVPASQYDYVAEALRAKLAAVTVGDPRNETVRMGALVSRAQVASVREGIAALRARTDVLYDGAAHPLVDADPDVSCCLGPTLLGTQNPDTADIVHDIEVFGPVATLMPYRDDGADRLAHALQLVRRGQGSLVVSLYGSDAVQLAQAALALADTHGRVHVVSPDVARLHTGHGNVMPQSLHGGPGRAGGGEELGGLRALHFYHRRTAVQASTAVLDHL